MDWKEIAVSMVLPMVQSIATAQVKELVDKLDVQEGDEDFKADLKGMYNILKRLESAATKSKTKIDDTVVAVFKDAVTSKAAEINLVLE